MNRIKKLLYGITIAAILAGSIPQGAFAAAKNPLAGWGTAINGIDAHIEADSTVKYSGDGSMKIVNNSGYGANKYIEVNTPFLAEQGKTYRYSFMAKSEKSTNISTMIDWNYSTKTSLIPFGGTFDWTKYEFSYNHTGATSNVLAKILVEDKGTFWIDNFECYEYTDGVKTGENLIKNSTFDTYSTGAKYTPYDDANEKAFAALIKTNSFKAEEINAFMGGFRYSPVFRADKISIDGEDSDWGNITKQKLPLSSAQYRSYDMKDGFDLKAETGYAYDDESFYFLAVVEDDIHSSISGSEYWKGDCIQLTLGTEDEQYGTEIGISYDADADKTEVYRADGKPTDGIEAAVRRTDKKTVYEVKIPWSVKFGSRPDGFLFSWLAADNDGDGREYVLNLTDGIAEDKTNRGFAYLEPITGEKLFYLWLGGKTEINVGEEGTYRIYCVNMGAAQDFTLNYGGKTEKVSIPRGSGIWREFSFKAEDMNEYRLEASAEADGKTVKREYRITGKPSEGGMRKYIAKVEGYLKDLKILMKKCGRKDIPTDYELLAYTVLERWAERYLPEDIENNFYKITEYEVSALDKIYNEAKSNLEAYLDGSKTAFSVPRYVTSKMDVDGYTVTADTVNSEGVKERRPVNFIGYGHFEDARADIPNFQKFGANTIQNEIGPNEIIMRSPAWNTANNNGVDAKVEICEEQSKSGKRSLKISNRTPLKTNVYSDTSQWITLKPSTAYKLTLSVKAENVNGAQISWNGGKNRFAIDGGTYDWKDYSFDFVTGKDTKSSQIWILSEDVTDAMYIDDISVCEEDSDVNLLKNPGFEGGTLSRSGDYWIYPEGADWVVDMLKEADKSNIAVSLLISPHYFPGFMYSLYPDMRYKTEIGAGNWSSFIPDHEKTKEVLKDYINALIPRIKDFKSLNNICLTNEPGFRPQQYGDFYVPMWIEFLKNRYHNSLEELSAAHGMQYTSWEDAKMDGVVENGKLGDSVCTYDTLIFANEVYTNWHKFLADAIHEIAPDIPVHAKAQGYLGLHGGFPSMLTNATNFENFSKFSDLAGCDYSIEWLGVTTGAHQVLGESLWYDYMAGIGEVPIINSEDHIHCDGEENFIPEQALWMQTNLWQGAIHHRGFSQIWVWRRSYNPANIYYGSPLFRPDCIKAIGKTNLDLNRLSYEVNALVTEPEDIAILYSAASRQYNEDYMRSVYNAYEACLFNGKKVRVVTESQIEKINRCKVLILPNSRNVPKNVLEEIRAFAEKGGKVIMLGGDTLTKDEYNREHGGTAAAEVKNAATYIPTESLGADVVSPNQKELAEIFEGYFRDSGMQRVLIVDAETGERVRDTEWTYAEYNGKLIVNICNYTFDTPKTVKIIADGKMVTASRELRSGEEQGESFVIPPCDPILLELEK